MASLKVHLKLHNSEKALKCEICSKVFIRRSHLKEHARIHYSKDKNYEGKTFKCPNVISGWYIRNPDLDCVNYNSGRVKT